MAGAPQTMLHKQFRVAFKSPAEFWRALRDYTAGTARRTQVKNINELAEFLDTRASHVAQTALYGYLRTRAGSSYPILFDNDAFMVSVNQAKWLMWLACLSDLSVFAGGLLANRSGRNVGVLVSDMCGTIMARTGSPADAGENFGDRATAVQARIAKTEFSAIADDDSAFTDSPDALVAYAPVIDSLKELDAEIVRNSVRYRWQEVRRELRKALDVEAVLASVEESAKIK